MLRGFATFRAAVARRGLAVETRMFLLLEIAADAIEGSTDPGADADRFDFWPGRAFAFHHQFDDLALAQMRQELGRIEIAESRENIDVCRIGLDRDSCRE